MEKCVSQAPPEGDIVTTSLSTSWYTAPMLQAEGGLRGVAGRAARFASCTVRALHTRPPCSAVYSREAGVVGAEPC